MNNNTIIGNGAEALIIKEGTTIIKERIPKHYRLPSLDIKIRLSRTRKEAKLLHKATPHTPHVLSVDEKRMRIVMQHIQGILLRDALPHLSPHDFHPIFSTLGTIIAELHTKDIIHGDLTSSNIILTPEQSYLIDFGLGFISGKIEDKAVDLHLFKHVLQSSHHSSWEQCWQFFLQGYQWKQRAVVLTRLAHVEQRGRYKRHPRSEKPL